MLSSGAAIYNCPVQGRSWCLSTVNISSTFGTNQMHNFEVTMARLAMLDPRVLESRRLYRLASVLERLQASAGDVLAAPCRTNFEDSRRHSCSFCEIWTEYTRSPAEEEGLAELV